MFDWLFEGRASVYVSLAAVAIVLLLAWQQTRKRLCLVGFGAALGLMGLYYLLDRLVEAPREQVVRKLQEMAAAVRARDVNAISNHISERFTWRGMNRAQFRALLEGLLQGRQVDEVEVWDIHFPDESRAPTSLAGPQDPPETILVSFWGKARGGQGIPNTGNPYEARFVRDPDGQWRMLHFEVFNPVLSNQPETIPGR